MSALLVQPFGFETRGGGGRVLRSLCANAPVPVVSACVSHLAPPPTDVVEEIHIPSRPRVQRIRSTRFGVLVRQLDDLGHRGVEKRLEALVRSRGVTAVHALADAYVSFAIAHRVARHTGARFTLSIWDAPWYKRLRFQAGNRRYFAALEEAWLDADARTVISEAMGESFCERYGRRPFVVVTDGLQCVAEDPGGAIGREFSIYFCGSIHLAHWPNFRSLFAAVDQVRRSGAWLPRIVLRGSTLPGAGQYSFVEERPWDATDAEIAAEVSAADVVYLPLPFGARHDAFTSLSMPTKLVTYAGSGRPILYHGPGTTAAAQVLRRSDAALMVEEQRPARLAAELVQWAGGTDPSQHAAHSLELARSRFLRERQQRLFWGEVLGSDLYAEHPR